MIQLTINEPSEIESEPTTGIEPVTSSLPRKRSTPELRRLMDFQRKKLSGRRGSNPRPTAWKAVALPTELLPLVNIGVTLQN